MAEAAKPGATNGYDRDLLQSIVEAIESEQRAIASIMGTAMNDCKPHHETIAETLQEAKDNHGIPKAAVRALLLMRKLERDKEKALSKLSDGDRESFDQMAEALGEFASTPLGEAALSKTKN